MTILAHKIALDPTPSQRVALAKAAGCSRVAYNWGLATWNKQYEMSLVEEAVLKPTGASIRKLWNSKKHGLFPFLAESPKDANIEALYDLEAAQKAFFRGTARKPKFHKKGKNAPSFGVSNDKFRCEGRKVRLPVIGWIKTREKLRFNGKILSGRVTCKQGRWFISVQVELSEKHTHPEAPEGSIVGVDLGVLTLATLSNGQVFENPRALKSQQQRLHRAELSIARKRRSADKRLGKQKKGERREPSKRLSREYRRIAKVHAKVSAIRRDAVHKATTIIAKSFQTLVIEDLNVRGMTRRARGRGRAAKAGLNRSILDAAFGEFRRQIDYKVPMYNGLVIKAGRFYPSSKKCSRCGDVKHNLKLQDRLFRCTCCGQWINRDLNAAINLETVGLTAYARGHCVKPIPAMAGGGSGGNSGNTERNVKSGVSSLEFT